MIAVDFTRTADSVARTGANLHEWMSKQEVKIDTSALFMPRAKSMDPEEEEKLMEGWNDELKVMEAFVLEGKKFVRLPEEELGHFYSEDCYVFLCRYLPPLESDEEEDEEDVLDEYQCVSYFWQGRDASNMGWLTFTFDLLKRYQSHFGDKLEVVRTHQQQENYKFLSHFKRKFVIHTGKRPPKSSSHKNSGNSSSSYNRRFTPASEFFYLRSNSNKITTRCIQVLPDSAILCSGFCYILAIPGEDSFGTAYVWKGNQASEDDGNLAEEIASQMYDSQDYIVSVITEGEEPDEFWNHLGGKKAYEKDSSFMQYTRLFRCSNDKGYFCVSEKCIDFCQDDLADEDIMILDNGDQVFVWVGSRCSDVEIKLALKSATVYVQNMRIKQPDRPRKLMLTFKGKETRKFTKCFHGWLKHKSTVDPRTEYLLNRNDDLVEV